jgi:hypothetical protein
MYSAFEQDQEITSFILSTLSNLFPPQPLTLNCFQIKLAAHLPILPSPLPPPHFSQTLLITEPNDYSAEEKHSNSKLNVQFSTVFQSSCTAPPNRIQISNKENFDYSVEEEKRPNLKLEDHWEFGFCLEKCSVRERKPRSLQKMILDDFMNTGEEIIVKEGWMDRRIDGLISDWEVKMKFIIVKLLF